MGTIQSVLGYVEVELTSASIPAALDRITRAGIPVWKLLPEDELTMRMQIPRNQYRKLCTLCQKHGDTLKISARRGLYWMVKEILSRPVLILGVLLLLFASFYLPTRVLFVTVEGNDKLPTQLILEAAQECGIQFWAPRREVRSERMKNALLEALPELRWAGINTYGCRAVISVSEKALQTDQPETSSVSSILASQEGIITSATATQGNLLCREGQAVKAGDVLISGYQDCGISIRAVRAEGEVFALTNRNLSVIAPMDWAVKGENTEVRRKYSLIFGKKRINLWKGSGISEGRCVRMYEEYYITLPGGFRLPVRVGVERVMDGSTVNEVYPEDEAVAMLTDFAERYLNQQMVAGRITQSHIQTTCDGAICRLTGNYFCVEMIGTLRHNEIGEYNGKDS